MGLFGRYTEKDFEQRTKQFKESLEELFYNVAQMKDCGKLVTGLLLKLDEYKNYPKGRNVDQAQVKAIDDRIDRLINSLATDAREENDPKFIRHAENLLRAIEGSRRFGKEKYDNMFLENEESIAIAEGEIHNALKKKAIVEQQMDEILEEAKKLLPSEKERIQNMELRYDALEKEKTRLDAEMDKWGAELNKAIKIESMYGCSRRSPTVLFENSFPTLEELLEEMNESAVERAKLYEQHLFVSDLASVVEKHNRLLKEEFSDKSLLGQENPKETEGPKKSMSLAERLGRL